MPRIPYSDVLEVVLLRLRYEADIGCSVQVGCASVALAEHTSGLNLTRLSGVDETIFPEKWGAVKGAGREEESMLQHCGML